MCCRGTLPSTPRSAALTIVGRYNLLHCVAVFIFAHLYRLSPTTFTFFVFVASLASPLGLEADLVKSEEMRLWNRHDDCTSYSRLPGSSNGDRSSSFKTDT